MGNRAVITDKDKQIGIYLHWNGGRDSVEGFLTYCKLRGFRFDSYGRARFCQVVGNFFGGGLSLGIDLYERCDTDNWDNGVYVVDNWEIVERLYSHGEQMEYPLDEMLRAIDDAQPESERLGEYLDSVEIPTSELRIGDKVWFPGIREGGTYELHEIVGFGTQDAVNGRGYLGRPYAAIYGDKKRGYEWNCNNYVRTETCRIEPRQ